MLYLCIHATHHEWPMLKWLVDVQTVLSEVLNWQKMTEKAERLEPSLVMRQTGRDLVSLGTKLPGDCPPADLPERVRIFPTAPVPDESPEAAQAFRDLRVLTRPWDRVRYFAIVIFTPKRTDCDFVRLPASLGFCYYFIRPLRLVFKWVGHFS